MPLPLLAGLVLVLQTPPAPDTIPFEFIRNQIVVPVVFDTGDTLSMFVDTGVTPSGIDFEFAQRAGLVRGDGPTGFVGGAGTGSFPIWESRIDGARIGRTRLDDLEAVSVDYSAADFERPFEGVLGWSFLSTRRVRIDYPARVLIVEPAEPAPGRTLFADSLVLVPGDIMPMLPIDVNGVRMSVSMDTGSSLTLQLSPRGTEASGAVPIEGAEQRLQGARGRFAQRLANVESIALGGARVAPAEVTLDEDRGSGVWGNLGNGFLKDFVLTLDYRARTLRVSAPGPGTEPGTAQFAGGPHHRGTLLTTGVRQPGSVLWEVATDGPVRSTPVIAGRTVYVGSHDGGLRALDLATGGLIWRFQASAPVTSGPAVVDDAVYATDHDGTLYAVGRADGGLRWRVDAGPPLPWHWGLEGWDYVGSSPAVADGTVVAGGADGVVRAVDRLSGTLRWEVRTGGRVRSSPAIHGGRVYVGSADGIVRALDLRSGEELWSFRTRGASLESSEFGFDRRTITGGPTVGEGRVYVGSRDARIYALDAATGDELWSDDDSSSAWVISTPALSGGNVIFGRSSSSRVQAHDQVTGAQRWDTPVGHAVYASPLIVDRVAYVTTGGTGDIVALDSATGAILWRRALGAASWASPAVGEGVLVTGSDDGVIRALGAAVGPSPRLAVFHDSVMSGRTLMGLQGRADPVRDFLDAHGFEVLDADGLSGFARARIEDGAPSVVVMAIDDLPASVAPAAEPSGLLHDYLRAGGKVVWVGAPPFWARINPETRRFEFDIERPNRFLGVDHGTFVTDSRMHRPTGQGRAWGLDGWWLGPGGVDARGVSLVLASDETGGAAAWVKSFGGPPGSGWVTLPWVAGDAWLGRMRAVAEAGVLRPIARP